MEYSHLLALSTFALIGSITPGPNNIMLMTSGANIGFYRTIPHMLGILFGFSFMIILVGLGLMQILTSYPTLQSTLQGLCLAYLLYLAYKIATSNNLDNNQPHYKPMSLLSAAGFQWINPKGWSLALSALTLYSSGMNSHYAVYIIAAVFFVAYIPSACLWVFAGQKMQKMLSDPKNLKGFNYSMASLLVLSLFFSI
ncbi:LysE family translocator [Psychromonas hadalis]|uniref:LysE family translocator n=1 Tax=Psychromonas hadalis TaxID=211669 RepID=UPI0003B68C16|nr:LysE family translocator [Psychromonas hadalis]